MKTRILTLLLTAAFLAASLTACGSDVHDPAPVDETPTESTTDISANDAVQGDDLPQSDPIVNAAPIGEDRPIGGFAPIGEPSNTPKLNLNRTSLPLFQPGATFQLEAIIENASDDITAVFSSSDSSVATISETGLITVVAPGRATITVQAGDADKICVVQCDWDENQTDIPTISDGADLKAFAQRIMTDYELGILQLFDAEVVDLLYEGLTDIASTQRLVYGTRMSMNNGEFVLIQAQSSEDVKRIEEILQSRIDYMVNGDAWYPGPTAIWTNSSRIVSSGNYVMMVVNGDCDSIVDEFYAFVN